ncbi:uncharacterized protein V2V93DRAFT_361467 [Kockiozyma suomiensis]|uniref:uncharacterized protein n=1 Tax=Kockiozyma suomiensis TaxID=1337062 RepID=UPI0033442EB1
MSSYQSISEQSPLTRPSEIPSQNTPTVVRTVFGEEYENYSITEKAATLITTNRRKRPVFSLVLGAIFAIIVVTLSLSLIRGYSDYSYFRATHDIPRRVNVTEMVSGEYYYSYSDYGYSSSTTYYPSATSSAYQYEPTS